MNKKILVCAYFAKNTGDDLFLKILFDRYPNVEWDLLTANRNYNKIFNHYNNVNIIYSYRDVRIGNQNINLFFTINNLFLKFKKYDGLINIGGSIFMQSPAWKIKFDEREYLLNKFKKLNKKAFIIGANFGPFKDEEFIDIYRDLFVKYDDVCFRDNYSYSIFKDLDNVRLAPDIVFSLENNKVDNKKNKSVGFSLIDIENREGLKKYSLIYQQRMTQLIVKYIELGYNIKLFPFCENEGDLKVSNSVVNKLDPVYRKNVELINYEGNLECFLDKFKSCDVIIGTRFHSIILGLLFNQGVYPIIYSEKTFNVLKDLNIENNCCYIRDIENLELSNVVNTAIKNRLEKKSVFLEAEKHFEKLDSFIGYYN